MTDKPENPPAYPACGPHAPWQSGMTLRDHFAGQAMPHTILLLMEVTPGPPNGTLFPQAVARLSYQMADAMLAERAK